MAKSLVRWEPTRELAPIQAVMDRFFDRALEDWFFRPFTRFGLTGDGSLAVDVYETDGSIVVKAAIPGVKAEDINVSVSNDTLTIKSETKEESETKRENYLLRERHCGAYNRSIVLPGGLKTDRVKADYANGVLTLEFPKSEEVKPKTIKVKAK